MFLNLMFCVFQFWIVGTLLLKNSPYVLFIYLFIFVLNQKGQYSYVSLVFHVKMQDYEGYDVYTGPCLDCQYTLSAEGREKESRTL
jgi:hypothetical protein